MVIHALGVHPRFGGRGLGGQMVEAAIALARESGIKAIRLDVLAGNDPARRIYVAHGFESVAHVQMYYENTGLADFELFELAL
jgi:ribosomal protein S18 acetylase RimI-like enzyme